LIKLLALAPGRRLHRERVMETHWPYPGLKAVSNNPLQTLHVARRALEPNRAAYSHYLNLQGGSPRRELGHKLLESYVPAVPQPTAQLMVVEGSIWP
jgi:hypothetical protein